MTAPGDPLIVAGGTSRYSKALSEYQGQGFVELENLILAAIVNQVPAETRLLWERGKGPLVFRGYIATVECRSEAGETAMFQVHYVAGNDRRNPTHLTFGSFSPEDRAAIVVLNGGRPVKGGRS